MYYQNYEDYMRQVLGYPVNDANIYESYDYRNKKTYEDTYSSRNQITNNQTITNLSEDEIQNCYPEIYHLVYPMVCKVCESNTQPVTRDLIEKMTDEVYNAIEDTSTVVNIRVDTPKENSNSFPNARLQENRAEKKQFREERKLTPVNPNSVKSSKTSNTSSAENRLEESNKKENRQSNSSLRDLIKILLLYRLFGNRPIRPPRPPRPPYPGGPGRPPFPGNPGSGRPPIIQPRDYQDYLEF